VHRHQDRCNDPRVSVVVNEVQSSGPLVAAGRRHLRIVT
jgi:hypothetical protein